MSAAHRPTGRLLALVSAVALLAGSGTLTSSAQAAPDSGIATVGECRDYSFDQALRATENSTPVDCGTSHTAKVLATPFLPDSVGYDERGAMERVMMKACYPAFRELLGRTESLRHRSAYTMMWFMPTRAQRDDGARWLRCDVVLAGGQTLLPLPDDTAPILQAAPLPDRMAACRTDRFLLTACSRAHDWRATGTYRVRKDAYPGSRRMLRIARRACPSRTSTRDWYATWANSAGWKAGDHTIVCYSKRRR